MQTSTPSPRRSRFAKIWNPSRKAWEIREIEKPRLPTDQEKELMHDYARVLSQILKTQKFLQEDREKAIKRGPEILIFFYLKLLRSEGYDSIRESLAEKELFNYIWELARFVKSGRISWDAFEDEVEVWYLAISHKLSARNAF